MDLNDAAAIEEWKNSENNCSKSGSIYLSK